jgi:transcriptional regulator with XRE-family HTH domain
MASVRMKDFLEKFDSTPLTAGQTVRSMRHNFRLSQEELAEVTGIKRENLSAIENDRIEMTVHYAEILGAALGLHPNMLLYPGGEFKKTPSLRKIERKAHALIKKKQAG